MKTRAIIGPGGLVTVTFLVLTAWGAGANDAVGWTPAGGAARDTAPPLPADPVAAVSADSARLLDDLRTLSADDMEGRRVGTPGNLRAQEYVAGALQAAGARAWPGDDGLYRRTFTFQTRGGESVGGSNLVGWLPGSGAAATYLVLTAHFDHVGVRDGAIYNGADDNASGTAALLFLARYLVQHPLRHPVVLAALDAEEVGERGARAFVAEPPVPLDSIVLDVNMDMVSRSEGVLWAAGVHHYPQLRPILEEVASRVPVELRLGHDEPGVEGQEDWTGSSDHAAFHGAGIPFVYFGVEDHPDYHRPTDDFERVKPREFLDAVTTILLALQALDQAF